MLFRFGVDVSIQPRSGFCTQQPTFNRVKQDTQNAAGLTPCFRMLIGTNQIAVIGCHNIALDRGIIFGNVGENLFVDLKLKR